jgi:DNA helicase-2/ATP-dependent DNA helicase PcrA
VSSNRSIVAAAGSGKTRYLVENARQDAARSTLLTTYTVRNTAQIQERCTAAHFGLLPSHLTVSTWFGFLLRHGVRPYQSKFFGPNFIRGINYSEDAVAQRAAKRFPVQYYTDGSRQVVSERIADLAVSLDVATGGAVVQRLRRIFDAVLIDEFQDFSGYHLTFVELLLKSGMEVILAGDPRQATYTTSRERKNSQYRGAIHNWMLAMEKQELLSLEYLSANHRSNQEICDFADALYPGMRKSTSAGSHSEVNHQEHRGVFVVGPDNLQAYLRRYQPQVLIWDKRSVVGGQDCLNFGDSKGLEFDHVLVKLPKTVETSLAAAGSSLAPQVRAKLYVALTRSRHSVALLAQHPHKLEHLTHWQSP